MPEIPDTRESLLIRVRDPQDRDAWDQFASVYRPVVYRMARARGLQDADAQDLAQKVLISVTKAIGDWKPQSAEKRFRHWLRRIAKNALMNALTRQPKDKAGGGTTALALLQAQSATQLESDKVAELEQEIDLEYRRQQYRLAAEIVRNRADEATWLAFSLTMVDGKSIADAAHELGRSAGMVYAARSRIIRRIRDALFDLQDE